MKVSDAFPSEFLKAADIGQSQVKVLISHVELREMTDGENKPVVFFQNKRKRCCPQRHQRQCHRAILR